MTRRLAKWLCIQAGNLAVRLAPYAGIELALRVGKPRETRLVDLPTEVTRYHDIRVTAIRRGGEYVLGWKVRADAPETAAHLFCERFLHEHQQSRRV